MSLFFKMGQSTQKMHKSIVPKKNMPDSDESIGILLKTYFSTDIFVLFIKCTEIKVRNFSDVFSVGSCC